MAGTGPGVVIVGGGPWGVALAATAARTGRRPVMLITRRVTEVLPRDVEVITKDTASAFSRASLVVLATPSSVVRGVLSTLRELLEPEHTVVHGVRGLVGGSLETITDLVLRETRVRAVGALGGPVVSADLLANEPSVMVCGASVDDVARNVEAAFKSVTVRIYSTSDLRGVEWATALVGCLSLVVGYAQQAGLNPGAVAAAISRGVHEAALLTQAAGGASQTLHGLAGYGDLLAAITQRDRPEVKMGAALARGLTVEQAAANSRTHIEAIDLIPRLCKWAEARGVRVPIFNAVADGVFKGRPVAEIVEGLMTLPVLDPG